MEHTIRFRYNPSRRIHTRKSYDPEIVFSHANRMYRGTMRNISLGGAFIETQWVNQFHADDVVVVNIPFAKKNSSIKRKGVVRWQNNIGFAVQFY